ncbi:hypothetical protein C1Y40_04762 [Mycobacterium talmoniae]|uniref:Uncharacterized protein n=1 Tax=Mycobacterium talmoniae TaxID=1858794 RepID=A0A2S8BEJ2_9MYCO|nr:hypothetical protein C1Y40_04762 [Mycobacterium talmoniae]
MSAGVSRAAASAWRSNACWAGPFGTVCPLLAPSWLTAEPRTSAHTGSPSRSASVSRLRTTTPHPSLRTYPSAPASNVLQRPSGASMPHREHAMLFSGLSIRLVPAARAVSLSRRRRLWQARCTATSDDEQAVSITSAGPRAPRKYANRPAAKFAALPNGT